MIVCGTRQTVGRDRHATDFAGVEAARHRQRWREVGIFQLQQASGVSRYRDCRRLGGRDALSLRERSVHVWRT